MPIQFTPGTVLERGDIDLFLIDGSGVPTNAYEISYALYYVDPVGPPIGLEVLIGSATRTPVNPQLGEYYAALMIPPSVTLGTYRIRWTFKETAGAVDTVVVQEFEVISKDTSVVTYSTSEQALINSLRILIRDHSPDRNYHFRPPEHEGTIKNYNRVFGFIWEDHELLEYMNMALDFWNAAPPETESLCSLDLLMSQKPAWRAYIMWGAIAHAALALSFNWISEEFSVGGEEKVDVVLPDGKEISVTMEELYDICK